MKKVGFLLFLVVMMIAFPRMADASSYSAKIYLDGQELNLSSGVVVENQNGTVMVPIRVVSEQLGFRVSWTKATQTVTVQNSVKNVSMVIGSSYATIDGQRVQMTKAPVLRGGTTLVPLRFVSEQMGLQVRWDNQQKAVYLQSTGSGGEAPGSGNGSGTAATVDGLSFNENKLMVAVSGNARANVSTLSNPDRIVIDLTNTRFSDGFGSNNNFNSVSQSGQFTVSGYPDVKSVRYSLFNENPMTVRIVVDLNYAKNYTVSGLENGSGILTVDLNTASAPNPGTGGKKLVVIDAGHGDQDPGAIGVTGKREKDFNLQMALKVQRLLQQEPNIDVVMTRSTDTFLELRERAKIANDLKADVFISIHTNSGPSSASGTETYYYHESDKALANALHKEIVQAIGLRDRGVKYGNFHVIRETNMPGALLEVGFLSNSNDESKLFDPATQDRVAAAIVRGLKNYLQVN
ncbi:N-acetylmuramoyl-L-alanine amidase family protein [Paenibacillus sp. 7541]|uniref:N-acetylmuramoyl-L-alanine amidase family protein n=1 Tax=Paenibacillus sp. 7541 TaxID=2026236 RepID=UPI000BA6612E|nr:N-acetylmuramoyl-L-alanine amidase family protein [Paenibacillus sp. 7541]PAK53645.1 N-acetylmuramoyl-L-alanine amidase [Paenibacillus sp. 7541]